MTETTPAPPGAHTDAQGRRYVLVSLRSLLPRPSLRYPLVGPEGRVFDAPAVRGRFPRVKMEALAAAGLLHFPDGAGKVRIRRYLDTGPDEAAP